MRHVTISWESLPVTAPRTGAEVALAANGWQALVAALAGPEWVYQVREQPEPVSETIDGVGASRPRTAGEDAIVRDALMAYLAENGVPAPPSGVEWRLILPAGIDAPQLWARLHRAVADLRPDEPVRDRVAVELRAILHGATRASR